MHIGCEVIGHGPTRVLLLHGWLSDRSIYSEIVNYFDQDRFTIALMDYRGYGTSTHMEGTFTLDEIAADALTLTEKLGWSVFHVVGHSMGGMVAQKLAISAPDRLKSLVAITPVPSSGFEMDAGTRSFFEDSATSDGALQEIFNILTGKRYSPVLLRGLTEKARSGSSTQAYLAYLNAWTRTDFARQADDLQTPALIIGGRHDGAISERLLLETYMKQMPNATLAMIEGAGHYPMIETPFEFFSLLERHLTQLGA